MPRSLLLGTLVTTLVYVLTTTAYIAVVPLPEMAAIKRDFDKAQKAASATGQRSRTSGTSRRRSTRRTSSRRTTRKSS